MAVLDVAVVVPGAVVELDEPDPALGQAAGHQAVRGEAAVAGLLDAVEVEDVAAARWPKSVSSGTEACIRNASSYWAIRVWISGSSRSSASMAVEPVDLLDDLPLGALADARRVADVVDGVALRLELDALELAGQEARPTTAGPRPAAGPCLPAEVNTMKPGRSSVSAPRP